jgi:hypothetical protein
MLHPIHILHLYSSYHMLHNQINSYRTQTDGVSDAQLLGFSAWRLDFVVAGVPRSNIGHRTMLKVKVAARHLVSLISN